MNSEINMVNTKVSLIDEVEISAILMDIKQHRKSAGVFGWARTCRSLTGASVFGLMVFLAVLILTLSVIVGFFVPNAIINQMWRLLLVVLFFIFIGIILLSATTSIFKKFIKNDNFLLQQESLQTAKWVNFINTAMKYKVNSLLYVVSMLEHDINQNREKDNKKVRLLLNTVIFGFVFYSIWSPLSDWGWVRWSIFFFSAIYTAITFFALITADEVPEVKKYIFSLRQAIFIKEKE